MSNSAEPSKFESALAITAVGLIGTSLVTLFLNLILAWFGVNERPAILAQLVLVGLPLGFLAIIWLLILAARRRSKGNAA